MDFSGKVAVVTGGASGIGRATCLEFLSRNAAVAAVDRDEAAGEAMMAEKRRNGNAVFGDLAGDLLSYRPIEYLTAAGLARASHALGLVWRRHRVDYPWWYELRALAAWFKRARPPSRFDLWEAMVP